MGPNTVVPGMDCGTDGATACRADVQPIPIDKVSVPVYRREGGGGGEGGRGGCKRWWREAMKEGRVHEEGRDGRREEGRRVNVWDGGKQRGRQGGGEAGGRGGREGVRRAGRGTWR